MVDEYKQVADTVKAKECFNLKEKTYKISKLKNVECDTKFIRIWGK
jgi:hypothetical protein